MPTADELQAQIAAIDARLNTGTTLVQSGSDRRQTDLAELRRQRDRLVGQLGRASGRATVRRVYTVGCKGL